MIVRSAPVASHSAPAAGRRRSRSWRCGRPRGLAEGITEFERARNYVAVTPRSSLCATCDDAGFALEVDAFGEVLADALQARSPLFGRVSIGRSRAGVKEPTIGFTR